MKKKTLKTLEHYLDLGYLSIYSCYFIASKTNRLHHVPNEKRLVCGLQVGQVGLTDTKYLSILDTGTGITVNSGL